MEIILRKIFPYFISIDEINKQKSQFKTHYEEKDNTGLCYEIPQKPEKVPKCYASAKTVLN
ncbi:hypothetical protein RCZ15_03050 [Capnocytophaga catalasegens]|uniref:Uncharacterized protein n=1 Tax=Capnocytophaga catalasegens TaxID=1004260 RepID=A0AAV5AVF3_9FLAO|nr:hypothetical protein RCZ03_09510 [Capnocytophaga catalasegens]GJM49330.1 hypothetical protein RCZ15_03050 [Capnocytophaga catalasegens]GJM52481.1 hypothetical protein RCZ16_07980 [Capnocytophaga catalasegens]